jgi:PmbA protein
MEQKTTAIESLAEFVKAEIQKAQILKWDLYLLNEEMHGIYYQKTEPELQTDSHNLSYYIRVFEDKGENSMGIGLVHLNTQSADLIQQGIKQAKLIANINVSPKYDLVIGNKNYPTPKTYEDIVWEDPIGFIKERGSELRQNLKEMVDVQTTFGKFRTYLVQKMLLNSAGFRKLKNSTYFCYEFSFKAENGAKKAEYWPKGYLKTVEQLKFDEYIREWVSLARDALRAKSPPHVKNIDVVFPAPIVRSALLATLGYTLTGQALFERTSRYKKDELVAHPDLTVMDDGLFEGGLNTSSWDSEGNPKQKTCLIEKGIMKNFLYDQKFATLMNAESTGNAQRKPTAGGVMQIEINNLVISPGDRPLREIVADTKSAIYVNDFSWLNPNPISGIFGAEIRNAYMIENGGLTTPIKGGNISGNIYEMLKNIDSISKETRVVMNANVPYMKFKGLTLSTE